MGLVLLVAISEGKKKGEKERVEKRTRHNRGRGVVTRERGGWAIGFSQVCTGVRHTLPHEVTLAQCRGCNLPLL
jgi:hypothetical protein